MTHGRIRMDVTRYARGEIVRLRPSLFGRSNRVCWVDNMRPQKTIDRSFPKGRLASKLSRIKGLSASSSVDTGVS